MIARLCMAITLSLVLTATPLANATGPEVRIMTRSEIWQELDYKRGLTEGVHYTKELSPEWDYYDELDPVWDYYERQRWLSNHTYIVTIHKHNKEPKVGKVLMRMLMNLAF